jgi:AraC-like DNA-binding protein
VTCSNIVQFSTSSVAPKDRLGYWRSILASTFVPMSVENADPLEFAAEVRALQLESVAVVAQRGSAQHCFRARPEIDRTEEHGFNLVLFLGGSWNVTHGNRMRFGPRDLFFHDSRYALDVDVLTHHDDFNFQLSEQFVRQWVPNPACLTGRRISDSPWGRVMASFVARLSPEFVANAPLPQSVLVDQIGALLALTATELQGGRAARPAERSVRELVHDEIKQRCAETALQAVDIASSLGISTRTLHRALAAYGETFGAVLIQARVDVATRMLQSPMFDRKTTAEIGRRAGFSDASHFTRVLRKRTGRTPLQLRRAR